jgi:uncharacterized protein (TIGR00369 family)
MPSDTPFDDGGSAPRNHGPFQDLVGYEIHRGAQGIYFTLAVRRDHINPNGVVHGGVLMTLLDAAGGGALVDQAIPGTDDVVRSSVTVSLTSELAKPVRQGVLYASGTVDHLGKLLAYVTMRVCQDALDGTLVARGVATFRIYPRSLETPV